MADTRTDLVGQYQKNVTQLFAYLSVKMIFIFTDLPMAELMAGVMHEADPGYSIRSIW